MAMRSEFHVSKCKFITNSLKYDRFMYLYKHFPSCKMRCKLSSTERPYQIMWPLTVADTLRNHNCIFQSTLHSCVIHTSRIEFMIANVILLIIYSYLALIKYSYPLANEIIGKFCRVSALTPAFYQSWIFISVWKACARWYVVRSIAFSHIIAHWIARK